MSMFCKQYYDKNQKGEKGGHMFFWITRLGLQVWDYEFREIVIDLLLMTMSLLSLNTETG